jgi:hypothetical protein
MSIHPSNESERPHRLLRVLRLVAMGLFITLVVMVTATFIVVRYYEDDVVTFAIERINNRLATKATVEEVDLTFWETFPHASLRFRNVYMQESLPEKDTLLFAENLFLEFSLMDLFRGDYTIREISADQGLIQLRCDEAGKNNWNIWKASNDSSALDLNLQEIGLEAFSFSYENPVERLFCDVQIEDANATGALEEETFDLTLHLKSKVKSMYHNQTEYMLGQLFTADFTLQANTKEDLYTFSKASLQVNEVKLGVLGSIKTASPTSIDIEVSGDRVDLQELLQSLPDQYAQPMKSYKADGNVSVYMKVQGTMDQPDIRATFGVNNGSIQHRQSGTSLKDITLSGSFKNPVKGKNSVNIDHANGKLETGTISASGSITDLSSPSADIRVSTEAELSDLRNFFAWDTLEICEGHIAASAHLKGSLRYMEFDSTMDWSAVQSTGSATLTGARFKLKQSSRDFTSISGQVELSNKTAHIKQLSGWVNGSDFTLSGNVDNLLSFLTSKTERLRIQAAFHSSSILFDQLVESSSEANAAGGNENYAFRLPERIDGALQTHVKSFRFRSFLAEDIKGTAYLSQGSLQIDPVSFRTAKGMFSAQLALVPGEDTNYKVKSRATLNNIDIAELFRQFENFGQSYITDSNLRGSATATVQLEMPVSRSLTIDDRQLSALIDIAIDNGQLIGLNSLQELALYLKANKWAAPFVNTDLLSERLKDIRFSRLENVIEIRNRTISFPQMDIRSSAMDINAQGQHYFDNRINYTIGFRLRDILVQRDHSDETDDGLGRQMFVYMRGTTDKPEFGLDKEASRESRKLTIQQEKQNVKALLKEEFGLFKTDPSIGSYKEKQQTQQTTTTIEWEGFQSSSTSTIPPPQAQAATKTTEATSPSGDSPAPKKKVPRWLQEKPEETRP